MLAQGASHQAKVALYTYNHPAYMEGVWAAMKAALAPVNVNYRYRAEELRYLLDNADAEFVIVHEEFAPLLASVRSSLSKLRAVLVVREPGSTARAEDLGGFDYETVADGRRARFRRVTRSARRPAAALHRRHHRHAQGRDVAPGRPVLRARRRGGDAAARDDAPSSTSVRDDRAAAGPSTLVAPAR